MRRGDAASPHGPVPNSLAIWVQNRFVAFSVVGNRHVAAGVFFRNDSDRQANARKAGLPLGRFLRLPSHRPYSIRFLCFTA